MLTNKDLEDTNWILIRKNDEIISGRRHYKVNIKEKNILCSNRYVYERNLTDQEINILVGIKEKEVFNSNGLFLGTKKDLGISTKTSTIDKEDNIYSSIKNSPGYEKLFLKDKKEKQSFSSNKDDEEMVMS